jgi:hypothetical protein
LVYERKQIIIKKLTNHHKKGSRSSHEKDATNHEEREVEKGTSSHKKRGSRKVIRKKGDVRKRGSRSSEQG